jgi:hypothetical protein
MVNGHVFNLFGQFMHLTPMMSKLMSLALLATLSAVNYVGVRESA